MTKERDEISRLKLRISELHSKNAGLRTRLLDQRVPIVFIEITPPLQYSSESPKDYSLRAKNYLREFSSRLNQVEGCLFFAHFNNIRIEGFIPEALMPLSELKEIQAKQFN